MARANERGRLGRRAVLGGLGGLVAAAATGATGCSTGDELRPVTRSRSDAALFLTGMQWGTPGHFNPLGSSAGWPTGGGGWQYLYETLLRFDMVTGDLRPGLGAGFEQPDATMIVIPMQEDARWQDGEPLTADDVVFTFELAERNRQLHYASVWDFLDAVRADGRAVVFELNADLLNPGMVFSAIAETLILPRHIWRPRERRDQAIEEFKNLEPVGSGPYRLYSFDAQQVILERVEDYWGVEVYGGLPAPRFLVHPIYKDNLGGDIALEQGRIDVSQNFLPEIWKMWEDKELPVSTWFREPPYHIPGGMPMLVFNTARPGLSDPRVRRALAHAVDYPRIAELAMSQYSQTAAASLVVPGGAEDRFFDADRAERLGWQFDPGRASAILESELGATTGQGGVYTLSDGTRLGPWTMQTPSGWTDWQLALRIAARNLTDLGVDVTTEFPEASVVTESVQTGDFDIAIFYVASTNPATPWRRFRDVLDARGVPEPGESAFWNYGRFEHPEVADLLDAAAATTDEDAADELYGRLDEIFLEHAPMIPLMYRPVQFFEFNESRWTGFPTSENPYAPPTFVGAGNAWLWEIELA